MSSYTQTLEINLIELKQNKQMAKCFFMEPLKGTNTILI